MEVCASVPLPSVVSSSAITFNSHHRWLSSPLSARCFPLDLFIATTADAKDFDFGTVDWDRDAFDWELSIVGTSLDCSAISSSSSCIPATVRWPLHWWADHWCSPRLNEESECHRQRDSRRWNVWRVNVVWNVLSSSRDPDSWWHSRSSIEESYFEQWLTARSWDCSQWETPTRTKWSWRFSRWTHSSEVNIEPFERQKDKGNDIRHRVISAFAYCVERWLTESRDVEVTVNAQWEDSRADDVFTAIEVLHHFETVKHRVFRQKSIQNQ